MEYIPNYIVIGLMVGGIYSLVAVGVVIVYKATKVFNFAVGEMVALGGCVGAALLSMGLNPWLSIVITMIILGLLGVLIERGIMRFFTAQTTVIALIATVFLSFLISGGKQFIWGSTGQSLYLPFPTKSIVWGDIFISWDLLIPFIAVMCLIALFILFFERTKLGLGIKAIADDPHLGRSKGIGPNQVVMLTWLIAGTTAAVGGIFLGCRMGVTPTMSIVGLIAFPIVFLGGLESIHGVIIAGLAVGVIEQVVGGVIGTAWMQLVPWILLIVVLIIRPYGLFGEKRVERV